MQVPRKFTSKVEGKMGYEDFVYFILSEEDKSSDPSLEYWYVFLLVMKMEVMKMLVKLQTCIDMEETQLINS